MFLDPLLQEIETRLLQSENRFVAEYLIPAKLHGLTNEKSNAVFLEYSADIGSRDQYDEELSRWKTRWQMADSKPSNLHDTLLHTNRNFYPSISTILLILLTMPASTITADRSFSTMKRIKTYLRSTMTTERLSALATLHAYREVEIDRQSVIRKFANEKSRKLDYE